MAIRGTTSEIEQRAKELRQQMTPAETRLWLASKVKQLDVVLERIRQATRDTT